MPRVPCLSLSQLLAGFAQVPAGLDRPITGLSSDSRQVSKGDLFLATQGLQRHGLEFLEAVPKAQVAAVVWEPPYGGSMIIDNDLPLLAVEGLSHKVGLIASRFYGHPSQSVPVVGITGTDGKTSCAHFIAQSLHQPQYPCGIIGTLGYGTYGQVKPASHTTPDALTLQRLLADMHEQGVRQVVMEISSHALEQRRVAGLTFAVAVLTNLTRDHLDYHGDLVAYASAKRRLFLSPGLGCAVLNLDDAFGLDLITGLAAQTRPIGYGLGNRTRGGLDDFIWGEDLKLSPTGLQLRIISSWGEGIIRTPLLGRFNASNVLATLATLLALEISFPEALERLSQLTTVPGRMERFGGKTGQPLAVVDYAHTPHSLEQVLSTLREHARGRLWCVFGCGGDRDPGKRPQMGTVTEHYADQIIVTDDNPRTEDPQKIICDILAGMEHPERTQVIRERGKAIVQALAEAGEGDIVLIAGKGHEDYQLLGTEKIPFSDRAVVRQWLEVSS